MCVRACTRTCVRVRACVRVCVCAVVRVRAPVTLSILLLFLDLVYSRHQNTEDVSECDSLRVGSHGRDGDVATCPGRQPSAAGRPMTRKR